VCVFERAIRQIRSEGVRERENCALKITTRDKEREGRNRKKERERKTNILRYSQELIEIWKKKYMRNRESNKE
jgi:hypothetical protein